ncbi:hypothetical protein PBY51_012428 [Eleginops maclovinus]|uniref:Uncharacterized protein n=1 Tax=Eleginops maclovinus TaxID=56733 RepID=A0AAN7XQL3_ELEMC|nr:hypothetical protein PBY51_012428 [Eleginops maclovinus]
MSEKKQLQARQYLRSWRSARQVMSSLSDALAAVGDMDDSLDLNESFEDRPVLEDDLDDWMDVDPSDDEEEDALGDDLEVSEQRPASLASDLASWACQFQVKHKSW